MNLTLISQIASAFSVLANSPSFGSNGKEVASVAGLVGLAFQAAGMIDDERKLLLIQINQANAEGRLLTEIELNGWKDRHEAAKAAIEGWAPSA